MIFGFQDHGVDMNATFKRFLNLGINYPEIGGEKLTHFSLLALGFGLPSSEFSLCPFSFNLLFLALISPKP